MGLNPMRRRDLLTTSAALPAVLSAQAPAGAPRNLVISSANGLQCCERAMQILKEGGDTLDAAIAGVNLNEEDPNDTSVGYGGLPNERGVVELDASVMHGPSRRAGSVAGLTNIRYPSRVAKVVMEQTDHIMLAGEGALEFAKAWGFPEENLLTERARMAWMAWMQGRRDRNGGNTWAPGIDAPDFEPKAQLRRQFPDATEEMLAWAFYVAQNPPTGTINCLTLNTKGEMSGVTTTSGLAWKIPGRIGDSPIIGAGLYVDQDVGAAGSTGRGEENIRVAGAHTIVENMRRGMDPKEACLDCLKRIVRNFNGDQRKLNLFDINFYAMRKDGVYAGAALWSGRARQGGYWAAPRFAVNDGEASRLEDCVWLLERKR
jgi:N4-(beta-N-acetylglucosaminyl)-L-asparaginase